MIMNTPVSPKVILMTVAALVAPAILAGLQYLQTEEGQLLFAQWSPILVVMVGSLIAGVATFVAGFIKSDPLRNGTTLSPKVLLSTAITIVATAVLAGLQYLQTPDGQTLFAALPPVLIVIVGGLITSVATFIGGYFKIDPQRAPLAAYAEQPVEG